MAEAKQQSASEAKQQRADEAKREERKAQLLREVCRYFRNDRTQHADLHNVRYDEIIPQSTLVYSYQGDRLNHAVYRAIIDVDQDRVMFSYRATWGTFWTQRYATVEMFVAATFTVIDRADFRDEIWLKSGDTDGDLEAYFRALHTPEDADRLLSEYRAHLAETYDNS